MTNTTDECLERIDGLVDIKLVHTAQAAIADVIADLWDCGEEFEVQDVANYIAGSLNIENIALRTTALKGLTLEMRRAEG
tara:strand:- start:102 stop:341 length:240 start_codon:yes stop_codon:yes gene_type:complete